MKILNYKVECPSVRPSVRPYVCVRVCHTFIGDQREDLGDQRDWREILVTNEKTLVIKERHWWPKSDFGDHREDVGDRREDHGDQKENLGDQKEDLSDQKEDLDDCRAWKL